MGKVRKEVSNIIYENLENSSLLGHTLARKCVNSDWGTIGFDMSKSDIWLNFVDSELRFNCIYFLFVMDKTSRTPETVYVGQAAIRNDGTSVISRLKEHINSTTEDFGDKWSFAAIFTNKHDTWDKTVLDSLESIFYDDIPVNLRLNRKKCALVKDKSIYKDKVDQIKKYLAFMGYSIFSDFAEDTDIQIQDRVVVFDDDNKPIEDLQRRMSRIPEYVTPIRTVKTMVDMLFNELYKCGKDLWDIKFLDPACKGGEFLREVYDRLINDPIMNAKFPDYAERSIHILSKQLFGISISQVSKDRATKKMFGYGNNIKIVSDYINKLKGKNLGIKPDGTPNNIADVIRDVFRNEKGEEMEFDVILGNPPYQEATTSIYQYFIDMAIQLNARSIVMIVRNNWLTSDTMRDTRDRIINFGLKDIVNYSVIGEIFPSVGVGVSIFNAQLGYNGDTHIREIQKKQLINEYSTSLCNMPAIFMNKLDCDIVKKVTSRNEESFSKEVYPQEAFRITSVMGTGRGDGSYILDFEDKRTDEFNVGVLCQDNGIQYFNYIRVSDVPNRAELINQYKIVSCAVYNYNENPITSITGLGPGTVCSATFAPLYASNDQVEAYGAYTYIKTKFFRYLVRVLCTSGITHHSEAKFSLVPMQDFTKTWTDTELYEKYGLTQEEINHIEKSIKALK